MALTAYMKLKGKSQGDIKGDCEQGGDKKDSILVYATEHKVEIPKDTHTGLPTGQRIHHPYKITMAKSQASPKLYKACCTGEQLDVTLDYYRIKPDGTEEKYFTVKMENAIVVEMDQLTPLTFLPESKPYHDIRSRGPTTTATSSTPTTGKRKRPAVRQDVISRDREGQRDGCLALSFCFYNG